MPAHKHLPKHDEHAIEHQPASPDLETASATQTAEPVVGRAFGGTKDALGGSSVDAETAAALRRRRGQGSALPAEVATRFGEQFGADFSDVRVHTDGEASRIAREVQATAFTHGRDIYFSQGTYAPNSESGQHLLAHELTHVVQQHGATPSAGGAPVIGKANDPAEHEADRMAGQVVGALRRNAAVVGAGTTHQVGDAQHLRRDDDDPPAPAKTAKEQFAEELGTEAPSNEGEAATRMSELRTLLKAMTTADRESISTDRTLIAKARRYVGDHEFMTLVAAVGMNYKPPARTGAPAPRPTVQHMSGAEADTFIQAEMGKIAHLMGFIGTAVGAGKKAEGYVAVLGQEDWEAVYGEQYDADEIGTDEETTTNAFVANQHSDRPAIIHHERGTRSTAIHESMHRYSVLTVLNTYGSDLNEGMTEYFTRKITDKDGNPTNGNAGASDRDNYDDNFEFVQSLLAMLGDSLVAQETALAKIYFGGDIAVLRTQFDTKCKAGGLSDEEINRRWAEFSAALTSGDWAGAKAKLPPPPAQPTARGTAAVVGAGA